VDIILAIVLLFFVSPGDSATRMKITSSAFAEGQTIPVIYAYPGVKDGKNISLPLSWTGAPSGTKSFALSVIDPHPVANNWIHWFVIDIPDSISSLAEGASGKNMPKGSIELQNSYGEMGYGGPEPPPGSGAHPYVVTVYALSVSNLKLKTDCSLTEFKKALEGKVLGSATTTGKYER